ncbi:MAG: DEAD/DEAH box helicase [Candidatus Magasanikbacteria bacterium]|nr:DEAD/DEAH box helicase [Candidatus Magasanikbacteria bacterium]
MTQMHKSITNFGELGLAPKLLSVLETNGFIHPTPIQQQAIPFALQGKDVVGIAQTGTGKTLAFGLPMIQILSRNKGQGLVLVPTRELALQVEETLQKVGRSIGLQTVVLIGGAPMYAQTKALRHSPHIIIATPGRLMDHMEQKTVNLQNIKIVVLDEADRMYDIGFAPQVKQILRAIPTDRQSMLFSATMPTAIASIATHSMKNPVRVEVAPVGTTAKLIDQAVYMVSKELRLQLLDFLLEKEPGTVLVFSRTKHGAKKIASAIRNMNHTAMEIHSDRSLAQRRAALSGFKSGAHRVLVATDIAARGIDVTGISLVINYDLPNNCEDYVHRIGRTGRAGASGRAVSFASPDERGVLRDIERLIKKPLPILALPVLPPRRAQSNSSHMMGHEPRAYSHSNHSRPKWSDNKRGGGSSQRTNKFSNPRHARGRY